MSKNKNIQPTDSELEVLQILWEHGPNSVRFVNEQLNKQREVGYTTTLKIMQLMVEKGLATRDTTSRTHIYEANVKEKETQSSLLNSFVRTTFRGSALKLIMQALGNHQTSKEELNEIKALIKKIEEK